MFSSRLWRILSSLWLEFWLPLPLLGLLFWLGGNAVMDYILSRPFTTANTLKLLADPPTQFNLMVASLSITAKIDRQKNLTKVEIFSIESSKKLKLKLSVTDINDIEAAIAQEINLSRDRVRKLIRYEIII
jgi:hypothetical protein